MQKQTWSRETRTRARKTFHWSKRLVWSDGENKTWEPTFSKSEENQPLCRVSAQVTNRSKSSDGQIHAIQDETEQKHCRKEKNDENEQYSRARAKPAKERDQTKKKKKKRKPALIPIEKSGTIICGRKQLRRKTNKNLLVIESTSRQNKNGRPSQSRKSHHILHRS